MKTKYKCLHCGKEFVRYSSLVVGDVYCSIPCYWDHTRRRPVPKRVCVECGKPITRRNTKYCSWECRFPQHFQDKHGDPR